MQMFGKVDFRYFLWLVCFGAVLGIGITGCGGDEEDDENGDESSGLPEWYGPKWYLVSINGKEMSDILDEDEIEKLEKRQFIDDEKAHFLDVGDILITDESLQNFPVDHVETVTLPTSVLTFDIYFSFTGTVGVSVAYKTKLDDSDVYRTRLTYDQSTYSFSGSRYTITAKLTINFGYHRDVGFVLESVESTTTGTWSVKEDTLRLIRDDGMTAVFSRNKPAVP